MSTLDELPRLIRELYAIVEQLERMSPGRKFTPDGHLVGSIGEVLAAHHYGLTLLKQSTEQHDAVSPSKINVQIKATQIDRIAISSEPDHLLVLKLFKDGTFREIFNGPGQIAWRRAGKMQKNGQRQISVAKLVELMETVPAARRIKPIT